MIGFGLMEDQLGGKIVQSLKKKYQKGPKKYAYLAKDTKKCKETKT